MHWRILRQGSTIVLGLFSLVCFAAKAVAFDEANHVQPLSPIVEEMVGQYCLDCHSGSEATANLDFESFDLGTVVAETDAWEMVLKKLQAGQMPPSDASRPPSQMLAEVVRSLEKSLDQFAVLNPRPGRTESFRRITRYEYQNAIRDLLSVEVSAKALLPADEISHGFDNITVGELSPTLVNRYITAAMKIARLVVGKASDGPDSHVFRVPPDVTQEQHIEGLPHGTRGGVLIPFTFPKTGEYEITVRLARDRNEQVEGLNEPHQLDLLLDSSLIQSFTVKPPRAKPTDNDENGAYEKPTHENVDRHLRQRMHVAAGKRELGVAFVAKSASLLETMRQPLNVHYNMYRHPRIGPAVFQVTVTGPLDLESDEIQSDEIQSDGAEKAKGKAADVRQMVARLLRNACRQPVTDQDLEKSMELYEQAFQSSGNFNDALEMVVAGILVHPKFLFRVEAQPPECNSGDVYHISDIELASRLSFFLWSSIPDDELLGLAERGELGQPDVLEQQTRRMLVDPRADALVENFASQWLYLRNLDSFTPDARLYPDFDDNLRQALRQETELFFQSIVREDRSVVDLLKADYTFLNERLAKHYGIPHVYGSRFRQVPLEPESRRGGLLRQGSILCVTSYATRTSPVIRGTWVLENILGTPPPPPPPNIPALSDNTVSGALPGRERLAQHRADPTCASCHNLIDPIGFSFENFDAVGRWRDLEQGVAVDAKGGLPDGTVFDGIDGLERGLLDRPEIFVGTLSSKLLTYAIGRGCEPYDGPAIREIVRGASSDGYRFSAIVVGIVKSVPFQWRTAE